MRLIAIGTTLLLATSALLALAPTGAAGGSCTELTDETCEHFVCFGRSTGYSNGYPREECKVDEEDIPNPCGPDANCQPGDFP
jgi:hypothetical protein